MYHLLVHCVIANRDLKGDKTNKRTQQYIQLNTKVKKIQQFKPFDKYPSPKTVKKALVCYSEKLSFFSVVNTNFIYIDMH